MKISLNWLNDYVQTGLQAEQIAEILSNLGLPCEGIEHLADDSVIDVEVTSNRGDCLSHIGIARELAAATGKPLSLPKIDFPEMDRPASEFIDVEIREPDLCGRYTARVIEGVKIGPSPEWMQKRLEAVGMRAVNNVVDATNYAMMETGQPPHAFDYATIEGRKIIVRKAAPGEQIVSIDGTQCAWPPRCLSSPMRDGRSRSPASWAAWPPRSATPRRRSCWRTLTSIRSASARPPAGWRFRRRLPSGSSGLWI